MDCTVYTACGKRLGGQVTIVDFLMFNLYGRRFIYVIVHGCDHLA